MKTLLLLVLFHSFALAAATELAPGYCRPRIDSKRYLEANFSAAYPRRVVFECTYECLVRDRIESIVSTTTLIVGNVEEDARDVVCQGIKTRKVPWGWDFDGVAPFYAFTATTPELKRYAFEQVPRQRASEQALLLQLKANLSTISKSYRATQVDAFVQAADVFDEIAGQLPLDTRALDRRIDEIVALRGDLPRGMSAQGLVGIQLKTHAAWRIPSYRF